MITDLCKQGIQCTRYQARYMCILVKIRITRSVRNLVLLPAKREHILDAVICRLDVSPVNEYISQRITLFAGLLDTNYNHQYLAV